MRKFFFAAAAAVVALAASASSADAAFAALFTSSTGHTLSIVNNSAQDSNSQNDRIGVNTADATVQAFITNSGFDISGTTFSFRNGTGTGGSSILTEAETAVERLGAGSQTITITVGYDGFTLPAANGVPMLVDSTVGFSGVTTGGGTGTTVSYNFRNWADDVPPAQNLVTPTGVSATTGTVLLTNAPPGPLPSLTTPTSVFNRTSTPFQVTSRSILGLNQNAFVSFTATTVISATPAPAGVVLVLAAMPVLGGGAWLRRRKAAKAAAV